MGDDLELEGINAAGAPQSPQHEGVQRETGEHEQQKQESSEDEKSDDLADLYVNDDQTVSPKSVEPGVGSPISASSVERVDSLDGVHAKGDETEGNNDEPKEEEN